MFYLSPERRSRILALALPIIGGMVSQNLLNIVDTAMVGFLGDPALAAVGLGGFVVFMCQALILGISTGVQTTAARRKGEGRSDRAAAVLNTALLLVLIVAPVFSIVLIQLADNAYPLLNDDPSVIATETDYGGNFCSMVWRDNLFASQFHPEKSQRDGLSILKGFAMV